LNPFPLDPYPHDKPFNPPEHWEEEYDDEED